jgi:peptidyl-Asp metalloendopeptidase
MKKSIFVVICTVILIGNLVFQTGSAAEAQSRNLFELKESPRARPDVEKSSVASLRESEIAISDSSIKANRKKKQSFPLLDGKIYEAALANFEERGKNDFTWRGKIVDGKTAHDVILTFKNGHVAGLIYAPRAVYEIVPIGAKHMLVEVDQSRFPECAGDVKDDIPANAQNLVPEGGTDSGDRIDVLLLYTTPVKNSLGGEAQAQAFAQSAIDSANTAYLNSKIRLRLRLVHAQETTFVETGSLSTELSGFRAAAETTTLRNQYNADLVAMISNSADNCGIGYLGNSGGNTNSAFTVTSRTCVVGNLSFAHELGHNMGSQHNPENGSGAAFQYSYGHYVNGNFRTVMSYVDPCTSGCTRRPYFSNPSVLFSGLPTGIEGSRDNARSINDTADIIANYRYSGSSITMSSYNGGEIIPRYVSRVVTWSSAGLAGGNVRIEISRTESTSWEPLVASTPNDGSATVNIPGRPTKNARIRITSIESSTVSDSSIGNIAIK